MKEERQERLNFLTRMAGMVKETDDGTVLLKEEDAARLVRMCCLAEKEADDRQQKSFERLCATPGVSFYEA